MSAEAPAVSRIRGRSGAFAVRAIASGFSACAAGGCSRQMHGDALLSVARDPNSFAFGAIAQYGRRIVCGLDTIQMLNLFLCDVDNNAT